MKKFGKFLFTTVSIAALVGGAVYLVKNVFNKDKDEDFDDFDDDFDDFDLDDEEDTTEEREYVTLNIDTPEESEEVSEDELEES